MSAAVDRARSSPGSPIRLTVASPLGDPIDGAWWPYTTAVARELPQLIEALEHVVGDVADISINWTALEGVPNLDSLQHRGAAVPGRIARPQRVMTVTGSRARVRLLVVPSQTSTALAVMVLRRAARLPVFAVHLDTEACQAADAIVAAARTECSTEMSGGRESLDPLVHLHSDIDQQRSAGDIQQQFEKQ